MAHVDLRERADRIHDEVMGVLIRAVKRGTLSLNQARLNLIIERAEASADVAISLEKLREEDLDSIFFEEANKRS